VHDSSLERFDHRFSAVAYSQFSKDVSHMRLRRKFCELQNIGKRPTISIVALPDKAGGLFRREPLSSGRE
jgi:hypothetical protein